jgi:SAM-dependent methyltransferase
MTAEGWRGWDAYAPFYDWENARTLRRRDVSFWRRLAESRSSATVLELGCGTGRISIPLARAGVSVIGIDRSTPMLAKAAKRAKALGKRRRGRLRLVRGDIRALPFDAGTFSTVIAPYGVVQSLLRDRDLVQTLASVSRTLAAGGLFGIDLVPDVARWREYRNRVQMRGPTTGGAHLTLVESVRQDRRRRLTVFEQTYIERRGRQRHEHRFKLTFRTLPVKTMTRFLTRAGFHVEAVLGDYRGRPWDERAEVWILLARKKLRA